jgi:hypothetical protein
MGRDTIFSSNLVTEALHVPSPIVDEKLASGVGVWRASGIL